MHVVVAEDGTMKMIKDEEGAEAEASIMSHHILCPRNVKQVLPIKKRS